MHGSALTAFEQERQRLIARNKAVLSACGAVEAAEGLAESVRAQHTAAQEAARVAPFGARESHVQLRPRGYRATYHVDSDSSRSVVDRDECYVPSPASQTSCVVPDQGRNTRAPRTKHDLPVAGMAAKKPTTLGDLLRMAQPAIPEADVQQLETSLEEQGWSVETFCSGITKAAMREQVATPVSSSHAQLQRLGLQVLMLLPSLGASSLCSAVPSRCHAYALAQVVQRLNTQASSPGESAAEGRRAAVDETTRGCLLASPCSLLQFAEALVLTSHVCCSRYLEVQRHRRGPEVCAGELQAAAGEMGGLAAQAARGDLQLLQQTGFRVSQCGCSCCRARQL
jgi:hypothetical protein